jgi:hypothetical protein
MGMLFFVCPVTGLEVSTELDVDLDSYADLTRCNEPVRCSHCGKPHLLSEIESWTVEPEASGRIGAVGGGTT